MFLIMKIIMLFGGYYSNDWWLLDGFFLFVINGFLLKINLIFIIELIIIKYNCIYFILFCNVCC